MKARQTVEDYTDRMMSLSEIMTRDSNRVEVQIEELTNATNVVLRVLLGTDQYTIVQTALEEAKTTMRKQANDKAIWMESQKQRLQDEFVASLKD